MTKMSIRPPFWAHCASYLYSLPLAILCYLILTLATTSSSLRSRCSLQAPNRFLHVAKINNGMSTHWSHYMYYCLHVCLVTDSCSPYHNVQKLKIPFGNCMELIGLNVDDCVFQSGFHFVNFRVQMWNENWNEMYLPYPIAQ